MAGKQTLFSWSRAVEVDGRMLEGGGQVLRMAIALSVIKKIPVKIFNIRGGRKKPGLAEQHLKGLQLVAEMCKGLLSGAELGSTEITFSPGDIEAGHFVIRVTTAGSVALLMQVAVPCALFAPGKTSLLLWGGTDADMAPTLDYVREVTVPLYRRFGAKYDVTTLRRGFFPRGGGSVRVDINNVDKLRPVDITKPGEVVEIIGEALVGGTCLPQVAQDMAIGADNILTEHFGSTIPFRIHTGHYDADCAGSSITVIARTSSGCILGAQGIGQRKKKPLCVGTDAAKELLMSRPGEFCLDNHAQDQVILPMALAAGTSKVQCGPLTLHTQTAIAVAELLTNAKFDVKTSENGLCEITCVGDPPAGFQ